MARDDRRARKASTSPSIERAPILVLDHDARKAEGSGSALALGAGEVFARDVSVRGWKIVGGKGFVDKARVGAYVGE
jgi:hypothetical protein